jgi:hypothetical protein
MPKDTSTEVTPNAVEKHRNTAPEKARGKELVTGETNDANVGDSIRATGAQVSMLFG